MLKFQEKHFWSKIFSKFEPDFGCEYNQEKQKELKKLARVYLIIKIIYK